MNYSGDVTPRDAYSTLVSNASARLIDVRTQPEWAFVGTPDLSEIEKQVDLVSWQVFPQMQVDPQFVEKIVALVGEANKETPLFFLCRSGQRSRAAAAALTEAGYRSCFNVLGGFEGDRDETGHRGQVGGWKFEKLPWVQS